MKIVISFALVAFAVLNGCGKGKELHPQSAEINLCDPADNPGACPLSLTQQARYQRDIEIGDEGIGILVTKLNDERALEQCRLAKVSLLDQYEEADSVNEGLLIGEFVAETQYRVVSEGSECMERDLFKSCKRKVSHARIVCQYRVHYTPELIPVQPQAN